MGINVQQLEQRLASLPGTFVLPDSALGVDAVKALFDQCLPGGTLTLDAASADLTRLTVDGMISLTGLGSGKPLGTTVTFATDVTRTEVTGIAVAVTLDDWKVSTAYLTIDASFLSALPTKTVRLLLSAEPEDSLPPAAQVGLEADFQLRTDSGERTLTLSGTAPPSPAGGVSASVNWSLDALFEDITLAQLGDLLQLVPKLDASQLELPSELPVLDQLELHELRVIFNADTQDIVVAYIDLGVKKAWPLIASKCELADVHATFTIVTPTLSPHVSMSLYATIEIAQVELLASITALPGLQLLAELENPVPAEQVFAQYLPAGAIDLDVQELFLSLDVGSLTYEVAFGVGAGSSGAWRLPGDVLLQDAYVSISGTGTEVPSGSCTAGFNVGGATVQLGGSFDSSGWTVTGNTVDPSGLDTGKLITALASQLHVSVPAPIADLELTDVALTVAAGGPKLSFTCTGDFPLGQAQADLSVQLDVAGKPFELDAGGSLTLTVPQHGGANTKMMFEVTFSKHPLDTTFTAEWSDTAGVHFGDLAQALGIDVSRVPAEHLPVLSKLSLSYDSATSTTVLIAEDEAALVIGKDSTGGWAFAFGIVVGLGLTVDLTDVPLIGKLVPTGDDVIALCGLRIVGASGTLTTFTPSPTLTQILGPSLTSGVALGVEVQVGQAPPETFSLLLGDTDPHTTSTPPTPAMIPATSASGAASTIPGVPSAAPSAPAPSAAWLNVQRSFGPVQIGRIGLTLTANHDLGLLLDGSVSLAGLTIALQGLEAEVPLAAPHTPEFDLAGLGVQFQGGGVTLEGGLEKGGGAHPEYTGVLAITLASFGATALGSYTTAGGQPSLFAFLFVDVPLGGPPCLFVTGLAGGFGYNRSLTLPTVAQVDTFPLVEGALGKVKPEALQRELKTHIAPQVGEDWLAAGVAFTSFEMVHSFALATVSFGTHFEIGLMGSSSLVVPVAAPGEQVPTVAEANLEILVDVDPSSGQLALAAQLAPTSYVLSEAAHLSGGFAFYAWFPPSDHSGDFVITLGGYNPYFTPPSYYPSVPRLGLNWQVSSELTVKGGLYFALTPSVIMAGGTLEASWQSGDVKAWFDAQADFLIRFKPFQYMIDVRIAVGASFKLYLLCTTKTITIHASVALHLWGPRFGGQARVHLSIISFTLAFGARPKPADEQDLDWKQFSSSFLPIAGSTRQAPAGRGSQPGGTSAATTPTPTPTPTDRIIKINAAAGLLGSTGSGDSKPGLWLVDPAQLRISIETRIPSKTASLVTKTTSTPSGTWNSTFGIGPMGVAPEHLSVSLTIAIDRDGASDSDMWGASAVTGDVPSGMWLNTSNQMRSEGLVAGVLTGVTLAPEPPPPDHTRAVPLAELLTDDPPVIEFAWSSATVASSDPYQDAHAMSELQQKLVDPTVAATRSAILAALNAQGLTTAPAVSVTGFARDAPQLLASPPLLRTLGEARGR